MSTQMDILKDRLFNSPDRKTVNFSIFPGNKPATPEQIAGEINRAMDQIEAGDFELIESFGDSNRPFDGDIEPRPWKDVIKELGSHD